MDSSVEKVIRLLETVPHDAAKIPERRPYYNMPATLTDSVLQAGMNYKPVVYPRVCHILQKYPDYRTTRDVTKRDNTAMESRSIQYALRGGIKRRLR